MFSLEIQSEDPHASGLPSHSSSRLSRYGPLLIWAALIFVGSTDILSAAHTGGFLTRPLHWLFPQASDATLKTFHFLLRKAGHFSEYAVLALFAARAFRTSPSAALRSRWFRVSFLLIVLYSLSDEYHQSFVPSRTASIFDSMIDSFGGLTALVLLAIRKNKRDRQDLQK
jgi:VanZ family protein